MSDSWTDISAAWLQEQIKAHPEMSREELRKWCSKNYPFHQRSGWAYKAWLKALRAYFNPQAVPQKRAGRIEPSAAELEARGQQRLLP
ncbi:hypothetical protein MW290_24755 [Aquincola tertiaricarbonis]|uniref:Uncharacterized protein n=1 Tax=Aquincola tertiaricarbonis TaxID=391953 RepID=A0ABY4S5T8_AQUTE|nr:hypothetical protein [Aquincola tertiaricarbonis]URI08791.1 hypothetical protein MW290_24755 [Aquincola tertiaricarbonis]